MTRSRSPIPVGPFDSKCPYCRADLPSVPASGDDPNETVGAVRCPGCDVLVFPQPAAVAATEGERTILLRGGRDEGQAVAHFRLIRRLGSGSFGEVWLCRDTQLERDVAVKLPTSQRFEGNLFHEARAAAPLNHPNIVSVYAIGNAGGQEFIASEYVAGGTLRDVMSTGRMDETEAAELLIPICEALHHAHRHGVIHRDVKPGNILVDEDRKPYVADFGLAKQVSAASSISSEGRILGTALYMSPEQAAGKSAELDVRTDLYAIGVILFEMLTGHTPVRGTVQAVLLQKNQRDAPSPRTLVPKLSRDIETVCLRCLERDRTRRYGSCREVADELRRVVRKEPIRARPITRTERVWRWCRRYPLVSGLAAAFVGSLTAGLVGVSYFFLQATQSASEAHASLYRIRMNLMANSLRSGELNSVRRGLADIAADDDLSPFRDFAYGYFRSELADVRLVGQHDGPVGSLALSPGGQLVAAVGDRGGQRDVRVWEVGGDGPASGGQREPVLQMRREVGRPVSVAFGRGGRTLYVGSSDAFVRAYLLETVGGAMEARLLAETRTGHMPARLLLTPDGSRLLTAGKQKAVRIWDAESLEPLGAIPGGEGKTLDLAIRPDGEAVAILKDDGRAWVRELGGELLGSLDLDYDPVAVAFAPDGESLLHGIFSIEKQPMLRRLAVDGSGIVEEIPIAGSVVSDIVALPQTQRLLIAQLAGNVSSFAMDRPETVREVSTNTVSFSQLALSDDGRWVATAGDDGGVRVLRLDDLREPNLFQHPGPIRDALYLTPDHLAVTIADPPKRGPQQPGAAEPAAAGGPLTMWNLRSGKRTVLDADLGLRQGRLAFDPDSGRLAVGGDSPEIDVWDIAGPKRLGRLAIPGPSVAGLAFLADGELLAVTREGAIVTFGPDFIRTARIAGRSDAVRILRIAVGRAADRLYLVRSDGQVEQRTLSTGKLLGEIDLPIHVVSATCLTQPHRLAVGDTYGEVRLLDGQTLATLWSETGHGEPVNVLHTLGSGPDTRLLSGGADWNIQIWDPAAGEIVTTLIGHRRQVFALATRRDGWQVLSGDLEGRLRIWTADPP